MSSLGPQNGKIHYFQHNTVMTLMLHHTPFTKGFSIQDGLPKLTAVLEAGWAISE